MRIMLKHSFGYAEHRGKATYGLRYKLTLTRSTNKFVLNKDNGTNKAKIKDRGIKWYIPHYTASIPQQAMLSKQILSTTPKEFQYVERSVFMKEVKIQKWWAFELGTEEGINVPIWMFVGFQQRDWHDSRNLNNDTFYRLPVTSVQNVIGTEIYIDSAILLNYDDDNILKDMDETKEL